MKQNASRPRAAASGLRPLLLLFMPIIVVKRLLSSQVKLRRRDGKLTVVLESEDGVTVPPPADPAAQMAPHGAAGMDDEADQIRADLSTLLARHERTRHFMRYLSYTERALTLGGQTALAQMPLDVLRKTRAQLEELVCDWSTPGLAQLRMQLEVLIAEKEESASPNAGASSRFDIPRKLQIEEATVSQFLAAERGWHPDGKTPS